MYIVNTTGIYHLNELIMPSKNVLLQYVLSRIVHQPFGYGVFIMTR
jgi:hypothetical protein